MTKIKNFLDIESISWDQAQIVAVPFGFEATVSYGRGTKNGPRAIIEASSQVELFDEELWQETHKKVSIATWPEVKPIKSISGAKKQIGEVINKILTQKQRPIVLGGEHSITPFIIEAYKNFGFKNFSILQFDAHADLRDGYQGEKYSHAAAMRRCLDFYDLNLVQVGIRNISNENDERVFWENNQERIKTFWAADVCQKEKIHTRPLPASLNRPLPSLITEEIIKNLKKDVYISFDVDALDPSIMPATGTPEPGGLDWYKVLNIIRLVCQEKNIIGADFVELAPIKNLTAPDFLVAKLIYRLIGYIK